MPSAAIAQALPYVNWMLLVSLAVGSFTFAAIARELSDATRGYLGFSASGAAVLAGLALLSDFGLTIATDLAIRSAPPELTVLRQVGLAAFTLLALAYVFALRRGAATLPLAALSLTVAGLTLGAAAFGWAPTPADAVSLLVQLVVLSAAAGGALAALVLGHWYLVTPRLSEQPLVLLTRLLIVVVAVQLALFVLWTTIEGGPRQVAFESLVGRSALFVWLRLAVGIAFPLVLSWMALKTAQSRSMESATGLLYLVVAAVGSGTIAAAALYVGSGLLV